jgi:hypothetical protein
MPQLLLSLSVDHSLAPVDLAPGAVALSLNDLRGFVSEVSAFSFLGNQPLLHLISDVMQSETSLHRCRPDSRVSGVP